MVSDLILSWWATLPAMLTDCVLHCASEVSGWPPSQICPRLAISIFVTQHMALHWRLWAAKCDLCFQGAVVEGVYSVGRNNNAMFKKKALLLAFSLGEKLYGRYTYPSSRTAHLYYMTAKHLSVLCPLSGPCACCDLCSLGQHLRQLWIWELLLWCTLVLMPFVLHKLQILLKEKNVADLERQHYWQVPRAGSFLLL